MVEELFETENLIHLVTLVITVGVLTLTLVAYYRTRLRRLLILALFAALLATQILLEVGDDFLEEGIPYFETLTSLFGLGIAILLLITVVKNFEWKPQ
jgi:hypothetical protein